MALFGPFLAIFAHFGEFLTRDFINLKSGAYFRKKMDQKSRFHTKNACKWPYKGHIIIESSYGHHSAAVLPPTYLTSQKSINTLFETAQITVQRLNRR